MQDNLLHAIILVSSALQFASGSAAAFGSQQNLKRRKYSVAPVPKLPDHFSDMYGGCRKKHLVSTSTFERKARSPRRNFEDLTTFLGVLNRSKMNSAKRDIKPNDHIVKCLQQNENTVTCFCEGKFYNFEGSLNTIAGKLTDSNNYIKRAVNHKMKRFCSNCAFSRENRFVDRKLHNFNVSHQTKKLSTIHRAITVNRNSVPYQEVMIEPSSRKWHPKSCYGFVAPQAAVIFSKKASSKGRNFTRSKAKNLNLTQSNVSQPDERLAPSLRSRSGMQLTKVLNSRRIIPSKFDTNGNGGSKNQKSTSITHIKAKRSQIVSVACRPLYIPTAKPSVNDGKVPQCRIPCGAHNCGPFPTCPCRPPSRTPPPPPTTCPPIPGLEESEATLTLPTRCPPYEFTDEPCPTFECKDGCPYLTTPGCPPQSTGPNKGAPRKKEPINEVSQVSLSEHRNGTGIDSALHGPSMKVSTDRGSIRTATLNHHHTTTAPIAIAVQAPNISMEEKSFKEGNPVIKGGRFDSNVTAKHNMMGSFLKSGGSQYIDSQVSGVWSNFDFKKLLKSAKSHYKEKVESNHRNYRSEA